MRWTERIAGGLAGLLAVAAAVVCFILPAATVNPPVDCGDGCSESSGVFGPAISAQLHSALVTPITLAVVAGVVLAVVALLDTRRQAQAARNWPLVGVALLAMAVLAATVGALLLGATFLTTYNPTTIPGPAPNGSSPFTSPQINVGMVFIPELVAAALCVILALWPRRAPAAPVAAPAAA